ncbi:MAG: hypothetical protein IJF97_01595 [Eggerthellaceae bacterium]|nr:hypothetical protein [Eggerthellaceae bacterium]
MAPKKTVDSIGIRPINIHTVEFTIRGTSPLIVHAWSHKAKQEMLDKQRGKKVTSKHAIKIPVNDFIESMYWLTEQPELGETDEEAEANYVNAIERGARFGFPCNAIKASIISGAYRAGLDVKQTELRGTFFIEGATDASTIDLAEITGPAPEMREDMVKVGGMSKVADIRYRGEFREWEIPLRMRYNADGKYSLEQILNMVNFGGFVCGVGEWRPEREGQFGMYELVV